MPEPRGAWRRTRPDRLEEVAAVLGHHYASAGEIERAVHHLEVAGDHAASVFANDEAISSYRYALSLVDENVPGAVPERAATELRSKLAEVCLRIGKHPEAREVLNQALRLVRSDDRSGAARLQAVLGKVETADHRYQEAMAAFDAAEELIGAAPGEQDQQSADLWLDIQLDGRANLHYWRNEPEKAAKVLAAARPVVEARGSPERRRAFYWSLAAQRMRETRYRVDEQTLSYLQAALPAARETGDEAAIAWSVFTLGFGQLWHGDLAEAERNIAASLAAVDRIGDTVLRARCLCYLDVTAIRRGDVEAVRALAPQALAAGDVAGYPEYVACARAAQAWVAWRDERYEDVVALASEALELWGRTVVSYSWYWICLWPLVAVHMRAGRLAEAVAASRQMLAPPQQRLPDALERLLQSAGQLWDAGEQQRAGKELTKAVALAAELHYT